MATVLLLAGLLLGVGLPVAGGDAVAGDGDVVGHDVAGAVEARSAVGTGAVVSLAAIGGPAPTIAAPRSVTAPAVAEPPPAPPPGAGVVAPGARYAWPLLPPPTVLTAFDEPADPFGRGHRGVDLAGASGQPVLAAEEGVVVHAGPLAGRGVVSVQHTDGLRTTYEPVTAAVAAGDVVARGAVLGTLDPGHPGCPGACLHWGARRDRLDYVDPLVLLRPPRVRLLPVPDPWPL